MAILATLVVIRSASTPGVSNFLGDEAGGSTFFVRPIGVMGLDISFFFHDTAGRYVSHTCHQPTRTSTSDNVVPGCNAAAFLICVLRPQKQRGC